MAATPINNELMYALAKARAIASNRTTGNGGVTHALDQIITAYESGKSGKLAHAITRATSELTDPPKRSTRDCAKP